MIGVDNRPEFLFSLEHCNGSIRRELLNAFVFQTFLEVRFKAEEGRMNYNTSRPD
jgi:putative transposase